MREDIEHRCIRGTGSPLELLEGLISPVPAQMLVAPPPDSPPPTEPGESTPVTGSLATAPSQSRPRVAPAWIEEEQATTSPDRVNASSSPSKSSQHQGLSRYFMQHPLASSTTQTIQRMIRERAIQPAILRSTNQLQSVGKPDASSGRMTTQPTDNPAVNQALATSAMSEYHAALKAIVQRVSGAELAAVRRSKDPKRLAEKIDEEGQPAQTVNDYGAAQISVDTPAAKDAVVAALRQRFHVLRERDYFQKEDPQFGYRVYSVQVKMPNGASEELQILPREVLEANNREHHIYKAARAARLSGRDISEKEAAAKKINRQAMHEFEQRNLTKGSVVTLRDGTQGTAAYVDPNMRIVRVRTLDGRNITVRRSNIV